MGSCIICGKSVEGRICDLHEEDALFEFRGSRADQLSVDRYYRGSVDGFAEFGVFVDIGDSVTGLLHRSELDQRLDSLDWDSGDTVYVQVKNVRDNGNVDLGWSIRQSEREFRGVLVDDPEIGHSVLLENEDDEDETQSDDSDEEASRPSTDESAGQSDDESDADEGTESDDSSATNAGAVSRASDDDRVEGTAAVGGNDSGSNTAVMTESDEEADAESDESEEQTDEATTAEPVAAAIGDLDDHVGADVRLEGEVVGIRQTSGPTVFELQDETGTVDCAAFVEAGVRAYPEVEEDDYVRLSGEVRERRGELQVETEELDVLEAEEREEVEQRLADASTTRPDLTRPNRSPMIRRLRPSPMIWSKRRPRSGRQC